MKITRVAAASGAVALVVAGWCYQRSGLSVETSLLDDFDQAVGQPRPDVFELRDVSLNGESRRAVVSPETATRLTWKRVRVPDGAWLRVFIGVQTPLSTPDGDGVEFLIGASDGRTYEGLFTQTVNPAARSGDRGWIPIMIDLSLYVGEEIDLVFNTRSGAPASPDQRRDLAIWGSPEIVR
jgi:hypothetical protein